MWTTSISLPDTDDVSRDSAGFITHRKSYIGGIPANRLDSTRNDELLANAQGYRADIIIEIESAAYNGAGYFIDESDYSEYDIKRAYRKDRSNLIQLTGERRDHGKTRPCGI